MKRNIFKHIKALNNINRQGFKLSGEGSICPHHASEAEGDQGPPASVAGSPGLIPALKAGCSIP